MGQTNAEAEFLLPDRVAVRRKSHRLPVTKCNSQLFSVNLALSYFQVREWVGAGAAFNLCSPVQPCASLCGTVRRLCGGCAEGV